MGSAVWASAPRAAAGRRRPKAPRAIVVRRGVRTDAVLAGAEPDDRDRVTNPIETGGATNAGEGEGWVDGLLDLDDAVDAIVAALK